jgi:hypothetical protein
MPQQQFKNHVRYYIPHHFIFYPVLLGILIICLKYYTVSASNKAEWLMLTALTILLGSLSFMMRQHYALTNQNRTVRLEMRLRYYQLTQKRFELLEQQLSFKQIAALRFAGDNELVPLIDKTLTENLQPGSIKKLVTDWQEDHMRV